MLESLIDGAASTEHLLQAYALHARTRGARADLAVAIARTEVFASPPGVATAFAREAAGGAAAPSWPTTARRCSPSSGPAATCTASSATVWGRTDPPEPDGTGHGARMLAATLAFEAMIEGADRDRAVALARFALDGDRLWAVDNGLFWVVAANVRMLADDDLGDFWARARAAGARPRLAVHGACRPASGRATGAGGAASSTRPWPA